MAKKSALMVFQDLYLHGPRAKRAALSQALDEMTQADQQWTRNRELEQNLHIGEDDCDAMAFSRLSEEGFAAAGLVLWSKPDGYSVANIVPLETGSLSYEQYNAILTDFQTRIALPAAKKSGYMVEVSAATASLDDWVGNETATALRRFSASANKSTGSAHPLDQKRWLDFLIRAHRESEPLDGSRLCRWLIEVENWPEDLAHTLTIEYEFGLALLAQYDQAGQ
jgi:hypothetical protein